MVLGVGKLERCCRCSTCMYILTTLVVCGTVSGLGNSQRSC